MPVLITGADSSLGAAVMAQLRPTGGQLRAYLDATTTTDDDAARLRAAGCKVAVGELDDEGRLEAALEQVHTVAHCWTGPMFDPRLQVEVAATLSSALLGAGVRRLIWVRELVRDDDNPYLAANGEIAALFGELPMETVSLLTALRHGPDDAFTGLLRAGWLSGAPVDGDTAHAPIHVADVARAAAAADRQRGARHELHLALALVGSREMTLAAMLAALGAPPLDARRPADLAPPDEWIVDWLSRPAVAPDERDGAITVAHGVEPLAR